MEISEKNLEHFFHNLTAQTVVMESKKSSNNYFFAVVSQLQDTDSDEEFYHLDLRTKCIQKLAPFPDVTDGRAVGVFKGRPIACGGRTGGFGSSKPTACYEYVPGTGSWTSIGNLVRHGVFELCLRLGCFKEMRYRAMIGLLRICNFGILFWAEMKLVRVLYPIYCRFFV